MNGRDLSRAAALFAAVGVLGACGPAPEPGAEPDQELSVEQEAAKALVCPGYGLYCGNDGVKNGKANFLYDCPGKGQAPSSSTKCAKGCQSEAAGTQDHCKGSSGGGGDSSAICPGPGDYCGKDGVTNGKPETLYKCPAAGSAPTSSTPCANGCSQQPPGYSDFCNGGGGSCSAAGRSALAYEASALATPYSYAGYCFTFVYDAYGYAGVSLEWLRAGTAAGSLSLAQASPGWVPWNGSCPCGALIYWPANDCNQSDGHVAICNGDGTVSSSGWYDDKYPWAGGTQAQISWMNTQECGSKPVGYILP